VRARTLDLESLAALYEQLNRAAYRRGRGVEIRDAAGLPANKARPKPCNSDRDVGRKDTRNGTCDHRAASGAWPVADGDCGDVVVDGAVRSQGVGTRLMEAATKIAAAMDATSWR